MKYGIGLIGLLVAGGLVWLFVSFAADEGSGLEAKNELPVDEEPREEIEPRRFNPADIKNPRTGAQDPEAELSDEPRSRRTLLISGRVINERGEPFSGVQVKVSGTPEAPSKTEVDLGVEAVHSDADGKFEVYGPRKSDVIRVRLMHQSAKPNLIDIAVAQTGIDLMLMRESSLSFTLIPRAGTTLRGLRIFLGAGSADLIVGEGSNGGTVVGDGPLKFSLPAAPGFHDFKILPVFGSEPVYSVVGLELKAGEPTDLGTIEIVQEAVLLHLQLRFPGELIGAAGFIERVDTSAGDDPGAKSALVLTRSGQVVTKLVPRLPVDLQVAFDRSRLLIYTITKAAIPIQLELGIEREVLVETAMALPTGVKLLVQMRNPAAKGRGSDVIVEQGGGPYKIWLTEYGQHELSLRLQVPKFDAFDRTIELKVPAGLATLMLSRDDNSPLRIPLDAELETQIRAAIESVK